MEKSRDQMLVDLQLNGAVAERFLIVKKVL